MTTTSIINNVEGVLNTAARLLYHKGDSISLEVIATAKPSIEEVTYDSWDNGIYGYEILLATPVHIFNQIYTNIQEIQTRIQDAVQDASRQYRNEHINSIAIICEIIEKEGWRTKAIELARGKGVTNQGRVRSNNIASKECDGLLFRSQSEIQLYKALKELGIWIAPLPVFLRGGISYKRIEPDFISIKDGIMMCLEVDGDTIHTETPAEAHSRLEDFVLEGVHVERIPASKCSTPASAAYEAQIIVNKLAKLKQNR